MHREQLQSWSSVIVVWTGCGLLTAAAGGAACGLFHPPSHELYAIQTNRGGWRHFLLGSLQTPASLPPAQKEVHQNEWINTQKHSAYTGRESLRCWVRIFLHRSTLFAKPPSKMACDQLFPKKSHMGFISFPCKLSWGLDILFFRRKYRDHFCISSAVLWCDQKWVTRAWKSLVPRLSKGFCLSTHR